MDRTRYRPHLAATLALGLPLIGSHLARMAIGVSDTVMVGWYGVQPLAALVLATSVFHLLFFLGMGYGMAVMGLVPTALASGAPAEVRRTTRMALWLSAGHGLAVMPLLWWSGPILRMLGQDDALAALAQDYLRIAGWGLAATLAGLVMSSVLAALGRAGMVLWVTLAGLPVNIALNWLLIFGNAGVPEMGVRGAALASLIVQSGQLALLVGLGMVLPQARPHTLFRRLWRPDWPALRQVFAVGLPIGLTTVAEGGLFVATNIMMGWIGALPLAAHGIALQITAVSFMIPLGLSNAATVRIGEAKGRRDPGHMRDAARVATGLGLGLAAVSAAVFVGLPEPLVGLYLDAADPEAAAVMALAAGLLGYAALFQLADVMQVVALGLLRGVHDTSVPMLVAIVAYWGLGLPAAWALAFPLGLGPPGLWLGLVLGLSVAAVALSLRFWRGWSRGDWTRAPAAA